MLKILVPFTEIDPRTEAALKQFAPDPFEFDKEFYARTGKHAKEQDFDEHGCPKYLHTPADNPYAYWERLQAYWGQGDDLIVIEQDIVIDERVIPAFRDCRHDWCTFAYPLYDKGEWMFWCLGCVRFSAEVQEKHPLIPHSTWFRLDTAIRDTFWRSRIWPHCHGIVEHTHSERGQDTPEAILANLEKCPDPNKVGHD